jgi:hypothetical protein
LFCVPFIEGVC